MMIVTEVVPGVSQYASRIRAVHHATLRGKCKEP
jgi:hypothetical protein